MSEKNVVKSNKEIVKPKLKWWYYHIVLRLLCFMAKIKFRLKVDKSALKGDYEPSIILCNHMSVFDPAFFCGAFIPKPLNCVVGYNMLFYKYIGRFFRNYPVIAKRQFNVDLHCIREIKKHLDAGISIMLFPEGRVTADGVTDEISPAIGKLVKLLGYPVICGVGKGGYVAAPKWGKNRSANVSVKFCKLLSADDTKSLSVDEINRRINETLYNNDNKQFIESGDKIRGRNLAEGLHKLLYKCPKCGAEFFMESRKDKLICTKCGNTAVYNKNASVSACGDGVAFERIDLWFDFQRQAVKAEVNENFVLSDEVRLMVADKDAKRFSYEGQGVLTLTYDKLSFDGERNGKPLAFGVETKALATASYVIGRCIDAFDGDDSYRFEFVNRMASVKYILAIEEIYRQKHQIR